jgi:putative spermidine/putrescine transport system substrate-binding protein
MKQYKLIGATAVAAVLAAGIAASVAYAQSAKSLTVVSWGGAYTKSQVEAYHKPFMAKNPGLQIKSEDYEGSLEQIRQIKTQVTSGKVTWDLIDVELADAVRLCDEGLLEKIDHKALPAGADGKPATDDFIKGTLHDCAVSTILWSTVYAFDASKFSGAKPTTIKDFFDTVKFPGKRGMRKKAMINLEFALMADGVAASDVYKVLKTKEGVDRAFKKLDTIKKDIVWWERAGAPPDLLADGQVVMTTAYNGRIFDAAKGQNKPYEIVWDGQVWDVDLWVIPKGSPNKAVAMDFLKYATSAEALAEQTKWISYAPARRSAIQKVGKFNDGKTEMASHLPTAEANFKNAVQNDFVFWADKADELGKQFNSWLAK